jgi:hypothetical protein
MVDLTVDLQVFMSAGAVGDPAHYSASNALLQAMLSAPECRLAVDDEGLILRCYEGCSQRSPFATQWLGLMAGRNKLNEVKRARVARSDRGALGDCGFVGEDLNWFVRTAAATDSGLIVAHDPHFHAGPTKKLLKSRLGVLVLTAAEARQLVDTRCQ